MTIFTSIHLSNVAFSRHAFVAGRDAFGTLYLDAAKDSAITGSERQLRALADELLELADDVAFQSTKGQFAPLSAAELARQEETRQAQRLALLRERLERVGGDLDD